MDMMKLRCKTEFAKTSGSCWRMIFVFALFPWLRPYRIKVRPVSNRTSGTELSLPDDESNDEFHLDSFSNENARFENLAFTMQQKCRIWGTRSSCFKVELNSGAAANISSRTRLIEGYLHNQRSAGF